jgi:hypothetical protein
MESVEIALPSTGTNRAMLDELMRQHDAGLTMFEAADLLGWHGRNNVNPRMQELKRDELVYKTGETRATGEGGNADVWRHTCFLTATKRAGLPAPVAGVPIPRSTPAPRSKAEESKSRPTRTRGASSTDRQITPEQRARAKEKLRAKIADGSA